MIAVQVLVRGSEHPARRDRDWNDDVEAIAVTHGRSRVKVDLRSTQGSGDLWIFKLVYVSILHQYRYG